MTTELTRLKELADRSIMFSEVENFRQAATPELILSLAARIERMEEANDKLGMWMSAALDDDLVCDEMKETISEWFETTKPAA